MYIDYPSENFELHQVTSTTTALRGQSEEVTEDNRRLRATCQRLEAEVFKRRPLIHSSYKYQPFDRLEPKLIQN